MREIKFRAWDKTAKQMYQVLNLGCGEEDWEKIAKNYWEQPQTGKNKFYPSQVEVMQYTGLKDKKGVEVYESDLVIKENRPHEIGVITWNEKNASFQIKGKIPSSSMTHLERMIVIGNIYENKELLEK